VGSGGQKNPYSPAASCTSVLVAPGCATSQRLSGSISTIRFMRSIEITRPPATGTTAPVVPVPRPRTTSGLRNFRQSRTSSTAIRSSVTKATASGGACRRELSAP